MSHRKDLLQNLQRFSENHIQSRGIKIESLARWRELKQLSLQAAIFLLENKHVCYSFPFLNWCGRAPSQRPLCNRQWWKDSQPRLLGFKFEFNTRQGHQKTFNLWESWSNNSAYNKDKRQMTRCNGSHLFYPNAVIFIYWWITLLEVLSICQILNMEPKWLRLKTSIYMK